MFETGVGIRNPLFFVGVVEGNVDERLEGRVRVRAFGIHGTIDQVPTENLPWAVCVKGDYDPNGTCGSGLPGENSWVFGLFLDGRDAQQPMILGLIPTQYTKEVNPQVDGHGYIPPQDADLRMPGRRPSDYGQPQNSRLSRGENIDETYVLNQEMNRVTGIRVGGSENLSWSEPASAYNAEYPYNKVIETPGGNSIELDSTPGAERIMIWHKSGSYTQVDTVGNKTDKTTGDKFEVNDVNQHVYVGGRSLVTIKGDSHVLVEGNKTEEIMGDHKQLVHGNYMLSVGSQMNLNASEEIQARGAQLRLESNVSGINMKAAKGMFAETGESMHFKSGIAIFQEATNSFNTKAGDNMFIEVGSAFNLKTENTNIDTNDIANIKAFDTRIGGGAFVHVEASEVAIDDTISMANGDATAPGGASAATGADTAKAPELPEPVAKGTSSANYRNTSSGGSAGYASQDDTDQTPSELSTNPDGTFSADLSETASSTDLAPLLDLIGTAEGAGYNTWENRVDERPSKSLTSMTVQEVLDWQEYLRNRPGGVISTASGRYQIIYLTLRGVVQSGGISANDRYNGETQDRAAISLMRGRGLSSWLSGSISDETFANNLAQEWASLPVVTGPNRGRSYYAGDSAGNNSRTSISSVLNALQESKANYLSQSTGPDDGLRG